MKFWKPFWDSRGAKGQIILTGILVIIIGLLWINGRSHSMSFAQIWQNRIDPLLTVGTILIAGFIWYNEKKQDWENNLPKKLNACFVLNGKDFYQVVNAPLTGADDVRQWGQQIGRQMNDDENLSFRGFKVEGPRRDTDSQGRYVMQYVFTVWLEGFGESKKEKKRKKWIYGDDGKFADEVPLENGSILPTP